MGIDVYALNFLAKTAAIRKQPLGRTLMLGRQGFHIPAQKRALAEALLRTTDSQADLQQIQPLGERWAAGLFHYLGATTIISMDASSYEGADMVHDLNHPVPEYLHGSFDTVFDGGTIEHIFDIPCVFRSIRALLKVGGIFVSVNCANNFLGHGLYQFSPELMWRAFGPENDFVVEAMSLAPHLETPVLLEAHDPRTVGRRLSIGYTSTSTYLCVVARKTGAAKATASVYQSDYMTAWKSKVSN